MNKMTIRFRVTLWYTIAMTVLVIIMASILFFVSSQQAFMDASVRIRRAVQDNVDEIEMEDGVLEWDQDLDFFDDGTYLSIYQEDGRFIEGKLPKNFENSTAFLHGELQKIKEQNKEWFIYDELVEIEGYGSIWIRGVASHDEAASAINNMVRISFIILPILIILIAFIGYTITKRAFQPVKQIIDTAKHISEGSDLSRRIHIGSGKDEIILLANTFDEMLNRLQESFERERQFTMDVSHELRTPTSVIVSECEYAMENAETAEELKKSVGIILDHTSKMAKMISQLLTLAHTESPEKILHIEEINISEIAEIIAEEQKESAKAKNITISTDIQGDIYIRADETMIMRVFINLISNAVKYGKEDGNILVSLKWSEDMVTGAVKDDGIGILEKDLPKIWNRFFQVDRSRTSKKEDGLGLGLSMVKWMIEAHRGTIEVESSIEEGTVFTFRIPGTLMFF